MEILTSFFVVLHLLGMGAIVGGYLGPRTEQRINPAIVWGARVQLITGLILVVFAEMNSEPNHAKVGVKLVVVLGVLACTELANARQRRLVAASATGSGGATAPAEAGAGANIAMLTSIAFWLTVLNVLVAVLWTA
ncbi:MAG: hypothetical protein CSA84_06340 [Actinomycetales bacterium]|nr:MAG: hypothetical protein CSA84_06340 [Actinomycetales bacterium]